MKKDTLYFPHDYYARNDEKILCLRAKYGAAGYGIFWILVEKMWESENGCIKHKFVEGLTDSNTTITLLNDVITYCIELELFDSDGTEFWSRAVNNRKAERDSHRVKKSEAGKKGMVSRYNSNTAITQPNTTITDDNTAITQPNKGKEKGKQKSTHTDGEIYSFESFWNDYAKKKDYSKCRTAWNYLTIAEKISIKDHVPRYVASTPDIHYRKNPLTYLHGKCWNDEILPPKGESPTHTAPTTSQPKILSSWDREYLAKLKQQGIAT